MHQSSLERKRLSKKRVREGKEVVDPFLSACTGVGGSDLVLSGDNVTTGDNDDSVSSAATSGATKEEINQLVVAIVSELGRSL